MDNLVYHIRSLLGQDGILDLSNKNLSAKSNAELTAVFSAISARTHTLNLGWNHFASQDSIRLTGIFSLIPVTVSDIILSGNALHLKGVELVSAFHALPARITGINLSWNCLELISTTHLVAALAAMKTPIKRLNLQGNGLGKKSVTDLKQIILPLMTSLNHLDLSDNFLNKRSGSELLSLFTQFSRELDSLILSGNVLAQLSSHDFAQLIAALPLNLSLLDLSHNALAERPLDYLNTVFSMTPPALTVLTDDKRLDEAINMVRLLHYVKTDVDDYLAFPIPVKTNLFLQQLSDDERVKLLHRLESDVYAQSEEQAPWTHLACIYLLSKDTDCLAFGIYPLNSAAAYAEFVKDEGRSHLMLDLINKMARGSSSLSELGEHVCLLLRNITPYSSVKERLNSLYLKPCLHYWSGIGQMSSEEWLPTKVAQLVTHLHQDNFIGFFKPNVLTSDDPAEHDYKNSIG